MSDVVLSASVRQNLLSLQSTADLLSTTQSRLSTGKKVNSALDNPTNYFTAAGLDSRASDINNLLDGIGNGVQILQAANTGITSLQKLVDSAKSIANQALQTTSGYTTKSSVTFVGGATGTGTSSASNLNQGSLTGASFAVKDAAGHSTTITIGASYSALNAGVATVKSLDELNTVLQAAGINLTAAMGSATDSIVFTSTNDYAGQTITTAGTAPTSINALDIKGTNATGTVTAAVADANSQATRASLISQYNAVMAQIVTTAQDASFNGVNLLNGDELKLTFNETGTSSLSIKGVTFNPAGLGLGTLTTGTDFTDNAMTNTVLTALNSASTTLRSQASTFGSNLSIVQIRQDFDKSLINVLQTGSSNLTLADTNEEAANSQALSTRQSIAVSALSLANQSQQSVLQLLR
ncbi:flagellin [Rhodopseudomonas sp.]|uniref:flagellin N-terminal helical domain-containing protein n=1 Tax=Rhodopseudomonas sp. TaxID=1078 RepID=UPI0039E57CF6